MISQERPLTFLRLDSKAATQIEHVVSDIQRTTRLEYDTTTEILSTAGPLEPELAHFDRLPSLLNANVGKHLVKVIDLQETNVVAAGACDHDLAAVLDDSVNFI